MESEPKKGKCKECGRKKELVGDKGICWKCHLGGISINARIEVRKQNTEQAQDPNGNFKYLGGNMR